MKNRTPLRILAKKVVNDTTCYQIQWENNNKENSISWQPVSSLFNHMFLVAEYETNPQKTDNAPPINNKKSEKKGKFDELGAISEVRESEEMSSLNNHDPQMNNQKYFPVKGEIMNSGKYLQGLGMMQGSFLDGYYVALKDAQTKKVEVVTMKNKELLKKFPEEFCRFLEFNAF